MSKFDVANEILNRVVTVCRHTMTDLKKEIRETMNEVKEYLNEQRDLFGNIVYVEPTNRKKALRSKYPYSPTR